MAIEEVPPAPIPDRICTIWHIPCPVCQYLVKCDKCQYCAGTGFVEVLRDF